MSLQSILVHVRDAVSSESALRIAVSLAGDHSAHLTGVHVIDPPSIPNYARSRLPKHVLAAQRAAFDERAEQALAAFEAAAKGAGVDHEWRCVEGEPVGHLVAQARCQDLVVMNQYTPEEGATVASSQAGQVVLEAGRPVLVVPHGYDAAHVGRSIVVAWNGSREAARATADALPLLAAADTVRVVAVNVRDQHRHAADPCARIVAQLARHGVHAAAEDVASRMSAGRVIVDWAKDAGADLVVMGAYGRGRVREVLFGGVTAHVLEYGALPVLVSH